MSFVRRGALDVQFVLALEVVHYHRFQHVVCRLLVSDLFHGESEQFDHILISNNSETLDVLVIEADRDRTEGSDGCNKLTIDHLDDSDEPEVAIHDGERMEL